MSREPTAWTVRSELIDALSRQTEINLSILSILLELRTGNPVSDEDVDRLFKAALDLLNYNGNLISSLSGDDQ